MGDPGSIDSYYDWNATLPSGYSGYQIIYSVWARSDSTETFYGCSDVVFDGSRTRTIHVDARYMLWTMDLLDGADHLIKEMGLQPQL